LVIDGRPGGRDVGAGKWVPLVAICLGTFMLLVDATIVQVALPEISSSLDASFASMQWVMDGYVVALASLLLSAGVLADRVGHRRFYLGGLMLFALASALCGSASSDTALVTYRIVQGIAASALFATTTALLNSTYQGRDRGKAFGAWAAVASAASALGPIIGGFLVEGLSWRWIFFVNLPICAVAVVLVLTNLSPDRRTVPRRVDVPGAVTFTIAVATLMYVLIHAGSQGWGSVRTAVPTPVAVAALVAFAVIERRSDHPMFDLSLLRRLDFTGVMVAALIINFVAFAPAIYTSIWLQGVEHISPIGVGLSQLPLAGAAFIVSWQTGKALHRLAPGSAIAGGLAAVALGSFLSMLLLRGDASWPQLLAGFALTGIGTGLAVPSFTAAVMGSVPQERGGMASGALNTARQLGFAVGIAVLGIVYSTRARSALEGPGVQNTAAASTAALEGLQRVFLLCGLLAVAGAVAVLASVRTHRQPTPSS
jgi:EmrB/QacA subfamily drug resistance transporter